MSAPSIPGLSAFPAMEQKYRNKYAAASRNRRCPKCDQAKVVASFRRQLALRQMRDKKPGKP